jgi:lipoprotein-anchoring transpeptidase ErfK/SrfK
MFGPNNSIQLARNPAGWLASGLRIRVALLVVASFALAVGLWYAAQVIVLDHSASAAINASVGNTSTPVTPDTPIRVTARGAGVELESAQLFRADLAGDGSRSAEQRVLVRLQPMADDGSWQIDPIDGGQSLRTDGAYRLVLHVAAPRPALPLPRTAAFDQQYRFTTVASPHARVPARVLEPRWAEPVSLSWSEPMQDLFVTVQPAASVRTWVDSKDATRTWLQLGGDNGAELADGQTYEINVVGAHAADGFTLQQPVSFKVAVPSRPKFLDVPTAPVTLRYGEAFTLKGADELFKTAVSTTPDLAPKLNVDRKQIQLSLPEYRQGAQFDLIVASAESAMGAPLAVPVRVHVVTPPAFDPPVFAPEDGSIGVQPSSHPSVTFAQPVADPTAAARALQIDPPVAGHWDWSSADTAVFVPDTRLPTLTDLTLTVRGGPDGPRTAAGGYLESDQAATFRTTDFKRIDVSLSRQTMTLFENSQAVRTIYVATGVAAAPTPTGTFFVQMKAPQMRFRGVNPDGSRYDIPDVHWVMPFLGDYTIHGAYWRPRFGVPGSDGCVSMSDGDAKTVYDWADVGTPVVIHS